MDSAETQLDLARMFDDLNDDGKENQGMYEASKLTNNDLQCP